MSADTMNADFKAYQDRITSSLVSITRNAAVLASEDLSFHRNLSDQVSSSLDAQNAYFLRLTNKLLKAVTKETNVKAPSLQNRDDIDDKWRRVVDVVDDLLEKADANLDEYNGGITRMTPQSSTPEPTTNKARSITNTYYSSSSNSLTKPQNLFDHKVDNFETGPWQPLLTGKPFAVVPLQDSFSLEDQTYSHPYAREIEQYKYPSSVYEHATPKKYTSPEDSQPVWVDTEEAVDRMLEELKDAKEIAVDLEHNDRNSYIGLVCLMQISTRTKDWLVDTLVPWRENLQKLNEVFADPSILKVFHGSASDMIWLQRDLGLYVVGLFDTFWAASALHYTSKSLAFLLDKFCGFKAQKQHQLADWRVRPLSQPLVDYARSDTHYLLYIYDQMRNELVHASSPEENLVDEVLEESKKESLQVYERRAYDHENGLGSDGWLKILAKYPGTLDKQQFGVLKALHAWRDQKARELDEGPSGIMTNKFLIGCAERLPTKVLHFFNNHELGKASFCVSRNPTEVLEAIERGKQEGLEGPTMQEVLDRNAAQLVKLRRFYNPKSAAKPNVVPSFGIASIQKELINAKTWDANSAAQSSATTEPQISRINRSLLWGPTGTTQASDAVDTRAAVVALRSLMPFHDFAEPATSITRADDDQNLSTISDVQIVADGKNRVIDEPDIEVPFTLRNQHKKKRTIDETEADDGLVSTSVPDVGQYAVTDEGDVLRYSDMRRAFKKGEDTDQQIEQPGFQPFDYANAQSVLRANAHPDFNANTKDSRGAKPFNPIAGAFNTTTGAKRNRMGKELAGKSHTFKS